MKQGAIVVGLFIAGQMVAAGVISLLVDMAHRHAAWARDEVWPWMVIAFVGITCGIIFLRGAFDMLGSRQKRKTT